MDKEKEAIREILNTKIETRKDLDKAKRRVARKFVLPVLQHTKIISEYKMLLKAKKIKALAVYLDRAGRLE